MCVRRVCNERGGVVCVCTCVYVGFAMNVVALLCVCTCVCVRRVCTERGGVVVCMCVRRVCNERGGVVCVCTCVYVGFAMNVVALLCV